MKKESERLWRAGRRGRKCGIKKRRIAQGIW